MIARWLQRRRDERVLCSFVVWQLRSCDLPAGVRDAALRLGIRRKVERPPGSLRCLEGPWTVSAFPRDETQPLRDACAFTHQIPDAIDRVLDDDTAYVLLHFDKERVVAA